MLQDCKTKDGPKKPTARKERSGNIHAEYHTLVGKKKSGYRQTKLARNSETQGYLVLSGEGLHLWGSLFF